MILNKHRVLTALASAALTAFVIPTTARSAELKDTVTQSIKAEVLYVDKAARQISVMELEGMGGDETDPVTTSGWFIRTFSVNKDVGAFDAVKAGDKVTLNISMSLSLVLRKPTPEEAANPSTSITVTDKNGALNHVISAVCVITKIDTKNSMLTFKGPRGRLFAVAVAKDHVQGSAKVGDQVFVTYTHGAVTGLTRM